MPRSLDPIDRDIIASLWADARRSNGSIAAELGVSEATVRARIKRLREERAIQIKAVTNIELLQRSVFAFVWVDADRRELESIASRLVERSEIVYVATTLGRGDLLAMALVADPDELSHLVDAYICQLPGVRGARSQQVRRTLKNDYRWARLV
jgi:Lrp/AsnC family transcriptional regulator for asnA, asnC and gidA